MNGQWFTLVVIAPLIGLWAYAIIEVIRRPDISWSSRCLWLVTLLVPVVGLVVYLLARPPRRWQTPPLAPDLVAAETIVEVAEQRQRGTLSTAAYLTEIDRLASFE